MANHFNVQVNESQEELEHRLQQANMVRSRERLQMLYWIKTQAITTRQELAQRLKRDASTVYRWLQRYKQAGIKALLEVKPAPPQSSQDFERSNEAVASATCQAKRLQELWTDPTLVEATAWCCAGLQGPVAARL